MCFHDLYSNAVCHLLLRDISNKTQSRLDIPDLAVMSIIHIAVLSFLCVNICSSNCTLLQWIWLFADVYESSIYRINTFVKSSVLLLFHISVFVQFHNAVDILQLFRFVKRQWRNYANLFGQITGVCFARKCNFTVFLLKKLIYFNVTCSFFVIMKFLSAKCFKLNPTPLFCCKCEPY